MCCSGRGLPRLTTCRFACEAVVSLVSTALLPQCTQATQHRFRWGGRITGVPGGLLLRAVWVVRENTTAWYKWYHGLVQSIPRLGTSSTTAWYRRYGAETPGGYKKVGTPNWRSHPHYAPWGGDKPPPYFTENLRPLPSTYMRPGTGFATRRPCRSYTFEPAVGSADTIPVATPNENGMPLESCPAGSSA